ncbi:MAG TPA: 3'-5' exonuclease [Polyangiaceae bacterium]
MRIVVDLGCFPTGRHYPGIAHLLRVAAMGLAEGFLGDHGVADLPLVAIDTETTGRDPTSDRVVEVACVRYERGQVTLRKSWLVNPGRPIPQEAFEVHGISDDQVKDAPSFGAILPELLEALSGAIPLAYNAEFDRKQLLSELGRLPAPSAATPAFHKNVEWIDPLVWARELQKLEKSRALGEVAARLGIEIAQAHRATDDAEAALNVFLKFQDDSRIPKTYGALLQEQRRLSRSFENERRWRA